MRPLLFIIALSFLVLSSGCNSPTKTGDAPYAKVQLGMSLDDAKKHAEGEGEKKEHDKLPATPKPRDVYSKLPAGTEWRVWSGGGKPILILGIVNGKVVFKQVIVSESGKLKGDASALPEYQ